MSTIDYIICVCLCSTCHVTDAVSADIVSTTWRNEDGIEIPQTDRAIVLVDLLLLSIYWEVVESKHVLLVDFGFYPHFVSSSDFIKLLHVIKLLVECKQLLVIVIFRVTSLAWCHRKIFQVKLEILLIALVWWWWDIVAALIIILTTDSITDIIIIPEEITRVGLLRFVTNMSFLKRSPTQNANYI